MYKTFRLIVFVALAIALAGCNASADFSTQEVGKLPANWPSGLPIHKAASGFEVLDLGNEKLLTYKLPYHRQLTSLGEELVQLFAEKGFVSRDSTGLISDTIVVRSLYSAAANIELTLQNKPSNQNETIVSINYRTTSN